MVTYLQMIILGLVQGITYVFPVSSFGHSVLLTNLFGWHHLSSQLMSSQAPFFGLSVVTQITTAFALIIFYRRQWVRLARGFVQSLRSKDLSGGSDARLAWLLIAAAIPAILISLALEKALSAEFATATFAIIFILANGIMLLRGDKPVVIPELARPRRRQNAALSGPAAEGKTTRAVSGHLTFQRALLTGVAQTGALLAGMSRSGITMVAGIRSGLNRQDAARFSFLLITPIILVTGVYGLSASTGIHGPELLGGLLAGVSAYFTVRFLDAYLRAGNLRPFGWYCIGFGVLMTLVGIIHGAN